jgi:CheY-like chemotaxis protein
LRLRAKATGAVSARNSPIWKAISGTLAVVKQLADPGGCRFFSARWKEAANEKQGGWMKQALRTSADRKTVILLADDDAMCLDVGARMLQHLGFRVLQAEDGREAVETFKKHREAIDLVILDMQMPHSGACAFDQIKRLDPGARIIVASGYSEDHMIRELMEKGCRSFIQKPFSIEKLSREIQKAMV